MGMVAGYDVVILGIIAVVVVRVVQFVDMVLMK